MPAMPIDDCQPAPAPVSRETPDPALIRGTCPVCGDLVVSHSWYVDGRGYLIVWGCRAQACDYRRVL